MKCKYITHSSHLLYTLYINVETCCLRESYFKDIYKTYLIHRDIKTSIVLKDVLTFYLWHLHVYLFVKICRLFVELNRHSNETVTNAINLFLLNQNRFAAAREFNPNFNNIV